MHSDLYQDVTDRIIAALEAGTAPWVKPWNTASGYSGMPWNPASGTRYRGLNVALLWMAEHECGYSVPEWMTYRQAQERGGQVRKGERGAKIIFWKKLDPGGGQEADDDNDGPRFVLRGYTVFNVAQIDGIEPTTAAAPAPANSWQPHDLAERLIQRSGADIRHGGDRAAYAPMLDYIRLPRRDQFADAGGYYSTALHELAHWTGHSTRCARDLSGRFGAQKYAAEELIAEIAGAYTCAALGVAGQLQHAEYIAHWLTILRNDKRAIFTAASQAQRAADYLLVYNQPDAQQQQAA